MEQDNTMGPSLFLTTAGGAGYILRGGTPRSNEISAKMRNVGPLKYTLGEHPPNPPIHIFTCKKGQEDFGALGADENCSKSGLHGSWLMGGFSQTHPYLFLPIGGWVTFHFEKAVSHSKKWPVTSYAPRGGGSRGLRPVSHFEKSSQSPPGGGV